MSKDSLPIYLRDHLAGAAAAIEILEALRDGHAGEPLGRFAEGLLMDIDLDRKTLETLAERVGAGSSVLKETTAWLGAKLARFKLGPSEDLGTLEALETVGLGILGKQALWDALKTVAPTDARLSGVDLGHLTERARTQHARVEERRLDAARRALQ
jgi:hypothetical protein